MEKQRYMRLFCTFRVAVRNDSLFSARNPSDVREWMFTCVWTGVDQRAVLSHLLLLWLLPVLMLLLLPLLLPLLLLPAARCRSSCHVQFIFISLALPLPPQPPSSPLSFTHTRVAGAVALCCRCSGCGNSNNSSLVMQRDLLATALL